MASTATVAARPRFARLVLNWFRRHGGRSFPWRDEAPDPYRVWISEIMLQQTGTAVVSRYYPRFIRRFPDAGRLARARVDEVLHLWSGLGYYARARALHRAAGVLAERYGGRLPVTMAGLRQIPGIGRTTAAAILAISHGQRQAILDGNVRRILCRYHLVREWPGRAGVQRRLWELAEYHTPRRHVADYTQAIMDLGATICVRGDPRCSRCPLSRHCLAHRAGEAASLPASPPASPVPERQVRFVILSRDDDGRVLLQRRPAKGVWGGLWSFPECPVNRNAADWVGKHLGLAAEIVERGKPFTHVFSHFRLRVHPTVLRVDGTATGRERTAGTGDRAPLRWVKLPVKQPMGLAAPVRRLIDILAGSHDRRVR